MSETVIADTLQGYFNFDEPNRRQKAVAAALEIIRAEAGGGASLAAGVTQMIENVGTYADQIQAALEEKGEPRHEDY